GDRVPYFPKSLLDVMARRGAELCVAGPPSPRFFSLPKRPPPSSTLFPYTTLFRSFSPPARHQSSCSTTRRQPRWTGSRPATLARSEEHTSELQSRGHLVCRLLLEKKNPIDIFTSCCSNPSTTRSSGSSPPRQGSST